MRLTSCSPALGMLTFQLVSLSKPVGPFNEIGMLCMPLSNLPAGRQVESRHRRDLLSNLPNPRIKPGLIPLSAEIFSHLFFQ